MERIKNNLIANFIGKFYAMFINLAFVPIYISFIGIEGYGLVGFYATLQAMFNLLDMGFSNTLKRELACSAKNVDGANESGDFLLTMQGIYLAVAIVACVSMLVVSPLLARHWLNTGKLSEAAVIQVIALFGVVVATRMVYGFYSGGLLGLQKQVLYNWQDSMFVTVRAVGSVLVLWLVSPTVVSFFVWQAISGLLWTLVIAWLLWSNLPKRSRPARLELKTLRDVWKYAAGLSFNSILGLLLNQVDKIVLSKMLSLEMFGYYALAGTISSSLQYLGTPVITSYFPSFVKSISQGILETLRLEYHKSTQVMAVAVIPVAGIFVFLSWHLIFAWTNDATIAYNAWFLTSLLSVAMALNQIASLPYNLQLAWKYTRLSVITNCVAVIALAPALYFGIKLFGAVGAAVVSIVLNAAYVVVFAQVMHKKFPVGPFAEWCFGDVVPIAASVALVGVAAAYALPHFESRLLLLASLSGIWILMLVASVLSAGLVRVPVMAAVRNYIGRH